MNTSKSIILKLVRDKLLNAMRTDRRFTSQHAVIEANSRTWKLAQPEHLHDSNPYNVSQAEKVMRGARARHDAMRETYEYVIEKLE